MTNMTNIMKKNTVKSTILEYIKLLDAKRSDLQQLSEYHYCGDSIGPLSHLYKLVDDHPVRRLSVPIVGIIAYGPSSANLAIRNKATGGFFSGLPRAAGLERLNDHMRCLRRIIIDPRYRGLGLAARLVRDTLEQVGTPMIEAQSILGRFHPFFQRAGMRPFEPDPDIKSERMLAALETAGINPDRLQDSGSVHQMIESLPQPERMFVVSEMQAFVEKFGSKRLLGHSIERTGFIVSKLLSRPLYYLWVRPDWALQNPSTAIK